MVDGRTALAMLGELMQNLHGVVVDDDREFVRGLHMSLDFGAQLDQASAERVARIYRQFKMNWGTG